MKNVLQRIKDGEVLLSDGAMGTLLIDRGVELNQCFESINLSQPEVLEDIARSYFEAGADMIHANTFGASPMKLALYSLEDKYKEINQAAVRAVRNAIGAKAIVSASMGSCGRLLKPYGDAGSDDVLESFKKQVEVLVDSGAEMLLVETMTDIEEARLAIEAAKSISESIPIGVTMTFDPTPRGFYTIMGINIETAVKELEGAGAEIIGSNCGNGIEKMIEIAQEFKKYASKPILMQPNAGLPEMVDNKAVYKETPEFMAEKAKKFLEIGVSIIGGCCGTTPAHIAAMRKTIDSFEKQNN